MKERIVLITNLFDVSIETSFGKITTHANAVVLSDSGGDGSGPRYRVHGFHNEAANPTFDLVLPSFDWMIEPHPSYKKGSVLSVAGNAELKILLTTDIWNEDPLDIVQMERTDASWSDLLTRKVLRYYHAPYFVIGRTVDADAAREALGVEPAAGASLKKKAQ